MHDAPPQSVCFSVDRVHRGDDEASVLTGSCIEVDDALSLDGDDFDFGIKLAADPYYYTHARLDGKHDDPPQQSAGGLLLELKLQIAKQQEKIDGLSSKISRCEVENEALRAENAILVDELAAATKDETDSRGRGWISNNHGGNGGGGGPMQMLIDTNAKLMTDNARLRVISDVTRKSFQSYIKEARDHGDKDKLLIKNLRREKESLQRRLGAIEKYGAPDTKCRNSMSDRTAKTSLASSFADSKSTWPSESEHSAKFPLSDRDAGESHVRPSRRSSQDSEVRESLTSIPEQEFCHGTSGDNWIIEGKEMKSIEHGLAGEGSKHVGPAPVLNSNEAKNLFAGGAALDQSAQLLVNFVGAKTTQKARRPTAEGRSSSFTERTCSAPDDQPDDIEKSKGLLVDFGERRQRPRSQARSRRWSSFRL